MHARLCSSFSTLLVHAEYRSVNSLVHHSRHNSDTDAPRLRNHAIDQTFEAETLQPLLAILYPCYFIDMLQTYLPHLYDSPAVPNVFITSGLLGHSDGRSHTNATPSRRRRAFARPRAGRRGPLS